MDLQTAQGIFIEFKEFDKNFILAGSARRKKETDLHDLDLIYVGDEIPTEIPNFEITVSGDKIVRGLYKGEQIDIYRTEKDSLGAMLLYLTGSKQYGIKMRAKAKYKGYRLNQYGLFDKKGRRIAGQTEQEIYDALGYPYKEPELRIK